MIELSYDTKELTERIQILSESYHQACLIDAIAEISKEIYGMMITIMDESFCPMKTPEYKVEIEGQTIECKRTNTASNMRTLSGESWIKTPNGWFYFKMVILVKLDYKGDEAHVKKVSLDVSEGTDELEEIRVCYSAEKDLLGGVSVNDDNCAAEIQKAIDVAWSMIQKHMAKRN